MRPALWFAPALLLGGCGNMYYQTRYIPISSESTYSSVEQMSWSGDKEAYELPANPPAIDEAHRARIECATPGQRFKPATIAGLRDSDQHHQVGEVVLIGGLDKDPAPGTSRVTLPVYPVAAWQDPDPQGIREPVGLVPVAASESGVHPFRGSGTLLNPPVTMAAYRSDEQDWCTSHPGSLTTKP